MEHRKISRLLNDSNMSKFLAGKWIEVNDLSAVNNLPTKI